jgi:hypothetical protein
MIELKFDRLSDQQLRVWKSRSRHGWKIKRIALELGISSPVGSAGTREYPCSTGAMRLGRATVRRSSCGPYIAAAGMDARAIGGVSILTPREQSHGFAP